MQVIEVRDDTGLREGVPTQWPLYLAPFFLLFGVFVQAPYALNNSDLERCLWFLAGGLLCAAGLHGGKRLRLLTMDVTLFVLVSRIIALWLFDSKLGWQRQTAGTIIYLLIITLVVLLTVTTEMVRVVVEVTKDRNEG